MQRQSGGNPNKKDPAEDADSETEESCVCIVDRTCPLGQVDLSVAQATNIKLLETSLAEATRQDHNQHLDNVGLLRLGGAPEIVSSIERSANSKLSSSKADNFRIILDEEDDDIDEEKKKRKTKKKKKRSKHQTFEERLKLAMERGCTPDDSSASQKRSGSTPQTQSSQRGPDLFQQSFIKRRRRQLSDEAMEAMMEPDTDEFESDVKITDDEDEYSSDSDSDEESDDDSFSEDSVYSFENTIAFHDLDGDYEDMQTRLIRPALDEATSCLMPLRHEAIARLNRRSLSEAYLDLALHLDNLTVMVPFSKRCSQDTSGNDWHQRYHKSLDLCPPTGSEADLVLWNPEALHGRADPNASVTANVKPPLWIINQSDEVDSKRFLIEWLTASLNDFPLVVYQASRACVSTDIIAAICTWIEEQCWTTEELLNALTEGDVSEGKFFG